MADTATFTNATQVLEPFKGVKKVSIEEYFSSGHRTCQGCESALVMKLMVKASGPRTIVLGSTGCMYVANTTYYSTPWVVPWMHTQLGSSGSAALGTAAGLKSLMKKGKLKAEIYETELLRLQEELVKVQYWVKEKGLRVVILFEGRDAAGKSGCRP